MQHFICHRRSKFVPLLQLAIPISLGSSSYRAQRFSRPPALSSRGQPAGLLHQVPPGEEPCLTNSTGTPYSKSFVRSPKTRSEPLHQLAKLCLLLCHTLFSGNLRRCLGWYPSESFRVHCPHISTYRCWCPMLPICCEQRATK